MLSLVFLSVSAHTPVFPQIEQMQPLVLEVAAPAHLAGLPDTSKKVPFVSQLTDIDAPAWKKVGCGVASLTMVIEFYKPETVSVNTLLKEGIATGAYLQNAGWTYKGLIGISKKYGFQGNSYDLGALSKSAAFAQFKKLLAEGPVIASVHYQFDPASTIPHLVVINRIEGEFLYYNDPAAKVGDQKISVEKFLKAWKKRFIVIRPAQKLGLQ